MIEIAGFGLLIERDLCIHQPKCGCKYRLSVCKSLNEQRDILKIYKRKSCKRHKEGRK